MALYKNTASQKIACYAYTASTGAAKTGDAAQITGYISKDWGAAAAITDTNPTELDATHMKGWYVFDLTQAETNANVIVVSAESSTSGVLVDQYQVFTQASTDQTGDAYARLGAPAGASVSADIAAVKAQTAAIEADTQDLQTQVGTDGAGLTAVPWNAAWDAEVQSEAADALTAYDPPTNAELEARTLVAANYFDPAADTVSANVTQISGDSTAADRLEAVLDATPGGTVVDDNDPDPTATAFETNLTEATNDHYNGAFVVFTSGALLGQSRKISDYDGTSKVLTVAAAFTEAPTAGDTFLILGRSE